MKSSVLKWELIGIVVISVLGSALHFAFAWSGGWPPVGAIAAVNESVFEHLKLTFWPTVLYAAITYKLLKRPAAQVLIAKAAAAYVMPVAIIVLFYAYKAITGTDNLIYDIATFVVAVALGQLASYGILKVARVPVGLGWLGLFLLVFLAVAYGLFTFYPPHLSLFLDSVSGGYGIP
jgi:hypothetical protein